MSTLPTPELEFIEKYGPLPDEDERDWIVAALRSQCRENFDDEWRNYWLSSNPDVELLERLYMFWAIQRNKLTEEV